MLKPDDPRKDTPDTDDMRIFTETLRNPHIFEAREYKPDDLFKRIFAPASVENEAALEFNQFGAFAPWHEEALPAEKRLTHEKLLKSASAVTKVHVYVPMNPPLWISPGSQQINVVRADGKDYELQDIFNILERRISQIEQTGRFSCRDGSKYHLSPLGVYVHLPGQIFLTDFEREQLVEGRVVSF